MLGIIGLGRMGFGMAQRILEKKLDIVAYNRSPEKVEEIEKLGAIGAYSVEEMLSNLPGKKKIWLMLPAGQVTDEMILQLIPLLRKGDIIIDGANDFYGNAERHSAICAEKGIHFFDVGVSGGVHGLENGYTLMIGGPESEFREIETYCKALAPESGYGYFGPAGSGHFVKSVHNIIEYVYLEGLAEGIDLLSRFKHPIDLKKATSVWQPASVINSWLLDLAVTALERKDFNFIEPKIASVTIEELKKTKQSVNGLTPGFDVAVAVREDISSEFELGKRTIAAIRREFGGHSVEK